MTNLHTHRIDRPAAAALAARVHATDYSLLAVFPGR
jgi:hypothetical protein